MPEPTNLGVVVETLLAGLQASEESMGTAIVWGGEEYPCTGGPEYGGKTIDEGGFRMQAKVKIKVRNAVFPDGVGVPEEKQTIFYKRSPNSDPKRYRIDAKNNYFDAFMELELNDVGQGA